MEEVKFEFNEATKIADLLISKFQPYCERIQIAGPLRRQLKFVVSLELVAIPKTYTHYSTFELTGKIKPDPEFIKTINTLREEKKEFLNKYYKLHFKGMTINLYIANLDNWGFVLAKKTGSGAFVQEVLSKQAKVLRFEEIDQMLTKGGEIVPVKEEEELFRLLNVRWVEPEQRYL